MGANIIVGDLSFRPTHFQGRAGCYSAFVKGDRSSWGSVATLTQGTDGKSYIISMTGHVLDARPSLSEAMALVVEKKSSHDELTMAQIIESIQQRIAYR